MEDSRWRIRYREEAIEDLQVFNKHVRLRIVSVIKEKLSAHPDIFGKPLRGTFKSLWRLRSGSYRVVYLINNDHNTIVVIAVGHRKDVYREIEKRLK